MSYLIIKNWKTFQHYKDRNPPWIKLHTDIFQNYEFSCLEDASKLLAICIYTLAARSKNCEIPCDIDYIKRQCNIGDSIKREHLIELINKGFLIEKNNAINMLADCGHFATSETEAERETETNNSFIKNAENHEKTQEKIVIDFPAKKIYNFPETYKVYESELEQYRINYPAVDILNELINLKNWMIENNCQMEYTKIPLWLNKKLGEKQSKGAQIKKFNGAKNHGISRKSHHKRSSQFQQAIDPAVQLVGERYS